MNYSIVNNMRSQSIYTVADIKEIYKDAKPKFVALKSPSGNFDIHYNQQKKGAVEEKFKQIVDRLSQKTLPGGLYSFVIKNSHMPNTQETEYPVQVGNISKIEVTPMAQQNLPSVWTMAEALKINAELQKVTIQNEFHVQYISQLENRVKELEAEILELEKNQLSDQPGVNNAFKDAVDVAKPLLDIFFEQRNRQLAIEEKKLSMQSPMKQLNAGVVKRSDGGVHPTDPGYQTYFEDIHDNATQEVFDYECDYLERNFPEFYIEVCKRYKIGESEETDNKEAV
jgi:hypothetical protein